MSTLSDISGASIAAVRADDEAEAPAGGQRYYIKATA
jgi:hypothetical protein